MPESRSEVYCTRDTKNIGEAFLISGVSSTA